MPDVQESLNKENVFNARHTSKLGIDPSALEEMCDSGYFLIHHEDRASHDPQDYADSDSYYAEGDMRRLSKAVREGACVAASYSMIDSTVLHVGYIEAGTEVEYPELPNPSGETGIYKAVQFTDYTTVRYVECPVLFTASARQGSSFCNWNNEVRKVVRGIALDEEVPQDVFSLSDGQFELLCDTWLKINHENYHLRLPVGKTMKDVDIIATAEETGEIAAQVTFQDNRDEVRKKVERLEPYGTDSTKKYLFARKSYSDTVDGTDIEFYSATQIFNELKNDSEGQSHVDAMLDLSRVSDD